MTFTNAPVTRLTVLGLVSTSIAASLFDAKHYFYIFIDTHLFRYRQLWRLLAYQLCYTNSTEVLFAAISLYNLRAIERMWGSRKYAVRAPSPNAFYSSSLASTDMTHNHSRSSSSRLFSQPYSRRSSLPCSGP